MLDVVRRRLLVRGLVQGVGFRPFVYALAVRCGLSGFVGNDSHGAFVEVEGGSAALDAFLAALRTTLPPPAHIDAIDALEMPLRGDAEFRIVESIRIEGAATLVPPDSAVCPDCLRELFDPHDRRFRYPFINCTHCGPRFTIIRDVPYDRAQTTMHSFTLCADCAREYADPNDRRFHAEPIACPRCGPQLRWHADGARGEDALAAARRALAAGRIVAVKGIGGFHLACDAANPAAVARLRERKRRSDKPFAVMPRDLAHARELAQIDDHAAKLLTSPQRPIVLLPARSHSPLAPGIAPGNPDIGLLLPYTPLHHLLVVDAPLVMTSGNRSDEPICKDDADAIDVLAGVADDFLMHDREIHVRCDDSVVRSFRGHEFSLRRARGYAPRPVRLHTAGASCLAVGAETKAAFCLAQDDRAWLSQHVGDMGGLAALHTFEQTVEHFLRIFRAQPQRIACDAHPGYSSSQWAERFARARGLPLIRVQHHHAHVATLLAENQCAPDRRVIGLVCDGTGFGADGAIWGCEVLNASIRNFERIAHLHYVPLPGGDAAIRRPYRSALAHLWAAGIAWDEDLPCVNACDEAERRILRTQLTRNLNCTPTSSLGRLFDAIASLLGVRHAIAYEGQAAIELQELAQQAGSEDDEAWAAVHSLDPAPLLRAVVADLRTGVDRARIAHRVHIALAHMLASACVHAREKTGLDTVAISGGVFQNTLLLEKTLQQLDMHRFAALLHHEIPTNDGGLALGQASVAIWIDKR
jgi:hydrogenase maturation protein HypF